MLHSKNKGNIGQLATGLFLAKKGYSVFTEEGDISKIDLIAEKNGKIIRFQCKAATPKNGTLLVPLTKSGPNYQFKYKEEMFDFFSLYDLENEKLYILSSKILRTNSTHFHLRFEKTKNNQKKGVQFASDYLAENFLVP